LYISAFTLILPLFPALIAHYRENDSSGLFQFLENKASSICWNNRKLHLCNEENFMKDSSGLFQFLENKASSIAGIKNYIFAMKKIS
jgi:hypothetical protein